MIDLDGYRPNVGIILANTEGRVLWARRIGQEAWQFPQGGIAKNETPEQALYRELNEEVGLKPEHVEVVAQTEGWLKYDLPKKYIRTDSSRVCIGQKQKWFLLRFLSDDTNVHVDKGSPPEFDTWRWVSFWYPLNQVVEFKRDVYRQALTQLAVHLDKVVDQ